MSKSLVITFTGPDRPGVVDQLARVVTAHDGNWEGSRLATFAGRFAGVVKLTVPDPQLEALSAALHGLSDHGLHVRIEAGLDDAPRPRRRGYQLALTGADHRGIVHEVARVLAENGVNIEELTTEQFEAPMSGELMFQATAWLQCPPGIEVAALRRAIERLALDLVVEIALDEAP